MINLYDPQNLGLISALIISYLLGLVHGITPDEHTWPITFSYAIGSYSVKGGAKAGLVFSSGFTLQRAILSEVAYLALAGVFMTSLAFGITYIAVGAAMFGAGMYIKNKKIYPHWHWLEEKISDITGIHRHDDKLQKQEMEHRRNPVMEARGKLKPVPSKLAFVHGIIAGFGFGAFALILYTVIVPTMPSIYFGWVPGFLFGIGTMTMQVIFGSIFGAWLTKVKKLTVNGMKFLARYISSNVLYYGGLAFAIAGVLILAFPQILTFGIITPLKVHNLHELSIGFFLVIFVVVIISILSYIEGMKKAESMGYIKHRGAHGNT
ncbi:conserved hypothetical protein, membrane [mine drainage metagenome]|uniref:Urease accessory protein UreH-like transmembrane domain-containing protein n=1 Tax=mine drainage metagenome TaxID=410659 RepID=T1APQ8_9ZZZZ